MCWSAKWLVIDGWIPLTGDAGEQTSTFVAAAGAARTLTHSRWKDAARGPDPSCSRSDADKDGTACEVTR